MEHLVPVRSIVRRFTVEVQRLNQAEIGSMEIRIIEGVVSKELFHFV